MVKTIMKGLLTYFFSSLESKKVSDSEARLKIVQGKVRGKAKPTVARPGRYIIREGLLTLIKTENGKLKKTYVFLYPFLFLQKFLFFSFILFSLFTFNDMIILSKQVSVRKKIIDHTLKYDYKISLPLKGCSVGKKFEFLFLK